MTDESAAQPQRCPVCSKVTYREFFTAEGLPTLSCALWPTEEAGRSCPRGDIALTCCSNCGYVGNHRFDPKLIEYEAEYENAPSLFRNVP